uniref:ATP-dependent Clp protease proteolytic subunit n=1 Tax=Haptolina ericina TaxID=156174 RepID=A0A7S3AY16_9EUKA|eukprot:CAMPEP_0181195802 /NCGR_PEP_ID=MMETSP1096-20121128/15092_1 /TAXON_ID=156174 ORGANISM="Chrysochromulina ericina, Strain CCMP281" /NCGR_SAMPLE_ID=MMETSP1096 /ASSEMBLY_ACC=CAM_ASM_000453 /LENGTH=217 /DNA_ID=CAMNT_0023285451 /DNA_START=24 /DNA_END=677 /DNA_ORIENTATION=-
MSELLVRLSTKSRHVFVSGTIDDEMAKAVIAQLLFLEQEGPGTPICMHINSSGGKVYAGLAIHDVMATIRSPVHTTCLGHCESMAAIILAAGEPGSRFALPNSKMMIHQPVRGASTTGKSNAREMAIQAAEIDRSRRKLATLLAQSTGQTVAEVEALLEHDHHMDAHQALALGLIDSIGAPWAKGRHEPASHPPPSDSDRESHAEPPSGQSIGQGPE